MILRILNPDDPDDLTLVPDKDIQKIISKKGDRISTLRRQIIGSVIVGQINRLVDAFYDMAADKYKIRPDRIDNRQFRVFEDVEHYT